MQLIRETEICSQSCNNVSPDTKGSFHEFSLEHLRRPPDESSRRPRRADAHWQLFQFHPRTGSRRPAPARRERSPADRPQRRQEGRLHRPRLRVRRSGQQRPHVPEGQVARRLEEEG